MIRSMTSFGRSSSEEGQKRVFTVEMKSVNSRYLDVNIRMPKTLISLEEEIRKMISNSLNRGKVDVFINLKNYSDGSGIPKVDINLAQGYLECLKEIEAKLGVKNDISVMQIARFPEVITVVEEEDKIETVWQELKPLINDSLDMMIEMREVEGDKLKEDILSKVSVIEQLVLKVEEFADTIPKTFKMKLEERVKELLGNVDIDESRIAMEVCMLADKATVDEEIIRLRSHINQVRETLNLKEPVGRKLDFIVQEMNRETNTIGSKSSDIQMTNIVIDIKNILEKIREQVQNIE
ncbi:MULTISPECIES: YicC/YloC family endoribonuclease [unclassified Clostridium]|uniref:YicC/YloC family endoribonuclease n=1 Tax=unclassified Clostridium TaxID=2614128 RepID=UPI001898906B|nr:MULTISPECIES: YicC/YloC family endoribonuclease [unclassified Clostridium]MBO5131097.1 YicC family protein [Romboutsia sp.]MBP3915399.1 YicC family protein [Clostridium sp.]MEE0932457.1 YicC/YloC family endoribonuclease [Clostridium sp.]